MIYSPYVLLDESEESLDVLSATVELELSDCDEVDSEELLLLLWLDLLTELVLSLDESLESLDESLDVDRPTVELLELLDDDSLDVDRLELLLLEPLDLLTELVLSLLESLESLELSELVLRPTVELLE